MKAHYNLRRVNVNDLINSRRYWGNDTIGRLFCHIFNIKILAYSVFSVVVQDVWHPRVHQIDVESNNEEQYSGSQTGYIYNIENLHFQYLDI